jgi:hypothetical protein
VQLARTQLAAFMGKVQQQAGKQLTTSVAAELLRTAMMVSDGARLGYL